MAAPTPDGGLWWRAVLVAHSGEGVAPRASGRLLPVTRPRMEALPRVRQLRTASASTGESRPRTPSQATYR